MKTIIQWLVLSALLITGAIAQVQPYNKRYSVGTSGATLTAPVITGTTWANIPSASTAGAGAMAYVTNFGTAGNMLVSNGTRWRPLSGCTVVRSIDTASSNINNSDTIAGQYSMPATMWQVGDRLRLFVALGKSGTTDTGTSTIRIGTAGTIADTSIVTGANMAAGTRSFQYVIDLLLTSATAVKPLTGNVSALVGYLGAGTPVPLSAVTISNVSNALFVSISMVSSGTTDTVTLQSLQVQYCASGN